MQRIFALSLLSSGALLAAINADVVKGRYFFVQYAQNSQFENPSTGLGTIDFGTDTLNFRLQTNAGATRSGTGNYGIDENARISAGSTSSAFAGISYGIISSDGLLIAGGQDPLNSERGNNFFFAIRGPTDSITLADLKGTFSFVQTATYSNGDSFGYLCSVGKMTFDGAGQISFNQSLSDRGQTTQTSGSGTYSIDSTGSGTATFGTARFAIGLSSDKRSFIIATINNATGTAVLIGMKDIVGVTPGNSRFVGAYALSRMAPDIVGLDVSNNVPYSALGYITPDGAGSFAGVLTERRPLDFAGPVFDEAFAGTYSVSSDGKTIIRLTRRTNVGFRNTLTGYQIADNGVFLGVVLDNAQDHGIAIGFHAGTFIGNSAIVDGAEFKSPVAPGSIVSVFGVGLGPWNGLSPGFLPGTSRLQTQTAGVSLTANGVPCPLYFVSFSQINCQMPFQVAGQTRVSVVATFSGVSSPTEFARIAPVAPRMFQGAIANALTNRLITQAVPARPGDYLVFYTTGLGQVAGGGVTGQAATAAQGTTASFRAQINGKDVSLDYAGLTPGFAGLYQVNVRVPGDALPGSARFSLTLRDDPSVGLSASFPIGN